MKYAICCCHNCHKLYAMANGNMLYTIYNVQYVICNLSVSFVKYLGNNCLSSLIFFTFETLPYTFILGYWLKFYGFLFIWVLWGVFWVLKSSWFVWKILKLILLMHEFLTRKTAPCKVSYLCHVLNFPFHSKESLPIGSIIRRSVLYVRLRWNRSTLKDIINAR